MTDDIEVTLETGQTVVATYANTSLDQSSSNADLNYERNIVIQQVNDIIASEQSRYDPDIHGDELPCLLLVGISSIGMVTSVRSSNRLSDSPSERCAVMIEVLCSM